MKARQILSLAILINLTGLFSPPFVPYAYAYVAPAVLGAAPQVGAASTVALEQAVSAVALNAAASVAATAQCTGYTYVEGFRACWDITLGLPTWGMCIAPSVCLGLGTVSLVAAGMLVAGSIFGGNDSGSGGAYPVGMALPSGSIVGCSGTPRISATPSSDPCLVYVPDSARTAGAQTYGNVSTNSSFNSVLSNNAYGSTASLVSGGNTSFNTGTNSTNTYSATAGSSTGTVQTNVTSSSQGVNPLVASAYTGSGSWTGSRVTAEYSSLTSGTANNVSQSQSVPSVTNTSNTATNASSDQNAVMRSSSLFGDWGDIQLTPVGVTIAAGTHEADGRSGIGKFYGYDAVRGSEPQALAREMCKTRPWSQEASLPPAPSFFDNICRSRGYNEVAQTKTSRTKSMVANASSAINTSANQSKTAAATSTGNSSLTFSVDRPRLSISAMPQRIRIGSRTTIYWSAKDVESCSLSSSDGSFHGNAPSGAADTVALYENTMFTITCGGLDGSSASKSVTVQTSD